MFSLLAACLMACLPVQAMAGDAVKPEAWQLGMQTASSPVAARLHEFHNLLLYIIIGITLFVLILLIYVMVRFNARANPEPSTRTHNVMIEILWTVIPVVILIIIAVPSFKLLYYMDRVEEPEMTLKVTGYQWYWGYDYPDYGVNFMSYMIPDEEIDETKGHVRLLSTDPPVVLPVNTDIQIIVTSADVLHSFAMPAFGIKKDAVPGRLNETWVRIDRPGTYYGQCSELCGEGHAFMPVEIQAVSRDEFKEWVRNQGGEIPAGALGEPESTSKGDAGGSEGETTEEAALPSPFETETNKIAYQQE